MRVTEQSAKWHLRLYYAVLTGAIGFALFYAGSCAHTLATCSGTVVRSFWLNWPTCVAPENQK